jgi:hypothetical protein
MSRTLSRIGRERAKPTAAAMSAWFRATNRMAATINRTTFATVISAGDVNDPPIATATSCATNPASA